MYLTGLGDDMERPFVVVTQGASVLALRLAVEKPEILLGASARAVPGEPGRREHPVVARDAEGVEPLKRRRPRRAGGAHGERGGGVGVGGREVRADDRDGQQPGRRAAAVRV